MFTWLRHYRERRDLSRLFGKYVPPELVEEMARQPKPPSLSALTEGEVDFILVSVHGESSADTARILGTIVQCASDSGWLMPSIMSNLVLFTSAMPPVSYECRPRQAVVALMLGPQIRIVHGRRAGAFGLIGSSSRMTFGALFPSFLDTVCSLSKVELGHEQELQG